MLTFVLVGQSSHGCRSARQCYYRSPAIGLRLLVIHLMAFLNERGRKPRAQLWPSRRSGRVRRHLGLLHRPVVGAAIAGLSYYVLYLSELEETPAI